MQLRSKLNVKESALEPHLVLPHLARFLGRNGPSLDHCRFFYRNSLRFVLALGPRLLDNEEVLMLPHQKELYEEICERYIQKDSWQSKERMMMDIGILMAIVMTLKGNDEENNVQPRS